MDTLSPGECEALVALLTEQLGSGATNEQFCDSLLAVLEDIPGLEGLTPAQVAHLAFQLWRTYREQKDRQN